MSRYRGLLKAFTRAFKLQLPKSAFWAGIITCLIRIPPRLCPISSKGRLGSYAACQTVSSIWRANKKKPFFSQDGDTLETDLLLPRTAFASCQRLDLSCSRIGRYEQTAAAVVFYLEAIGCRFFCLATYRKHATVSLWDSTHGLLRY